jgi:hypothetical protein
MAHNVQHRVYHSLVLSALKCYGGPKTLPWSNPQHQERKGWTLKQPMKTIW